MTPGMYLFINRGLNMSPGKIAAQAGHAALEAALITDRDSELWRKWREGGHYSKYVMLARDNEHLRDIERYLNDRGFDTVLILDEGHTEVPSISPTALGVALVDRADPHTKATFSTFDLYKEPRPEQERLSHPIYQLNNTGFVGQNAAYPQIAPLSHEEYRQQSQEFIARLCSPTPAKGSYSLPGPPADTRSWMRKLVHWLKQ